MNKIKIFKIFIYFYLIVFLFNYCTNKNDANNKDTILNFEINFGKLNSEDLSFVINDFEKNLINKYPNLDVKFAYKEYVKSYIKNNKVPIITFKKETLDILNDNCFRANFYNLVYNHYSSHTNYYLSIFKTKNIDSLTLKHITFIQTGGVNYDFSVAEDFFLHYADYDNYFHKRFLFIYFYITPPDYTILKNYKHEINSEIILPPSSDSIQILYR